MFPLPSRVYTRCATILVRTIRMASCHEFHWAVTVPWFPILTCVGARKQERAGEELPPRPFLLSGSSPIWRCSISALDAPSQESKKPLVSTASPNPGTPQTHSANRSRNSLTVEHTASGCAANKALLSAAPHVAATAYTPAAFDATMSFG